jgi:hypothetical protein
VNTHFSTLPCFIAGFPPFYQNGFGNPATRPGVTKRARTRHVCA